MAAEPGQVSRIGPITAEVARALATVAVGAADCEWRLIITGRAGNALAVTTIRKSWLGPKRRVGAAGEQHRRGCRVVTRVVLTLPLTALDEAKAPGPDIAGRAWPPELRPVLAAALRAASRTAERARAASRLAADGSSRGGVCQHEDAVPGYRVPDSMRALLEARDRTCRHPGCRCPAWRSDQDHTIPYEQGGPTCPCNLSSECRHHHRLKQLSNWLLSQPRPGVLTWRTPAGLAYTAGPEPYGA
ncbi:MAG: HNH endonuclease [Actinobacteria bacterium]|nr:HNH endonuclease [Actinomycetota bacterium]